MTTTAEELHAVLAHLSPEDQERVLAYARALSAQPPQKPPLPSTPGSVLLGFTVSPEVGALMAQALEESERIDEDEWQ